MNIKQNTGFTVIDRTRQAAESLRNDVGKTLLSRDGKEKGIVRQISSRYCAGCQSNHPCYIVLWDDATTTKPCTAGVKTNPDGTLQIM